MFLSTRLPVTLCRGSTRCRDAVRRYLHLNPTNGPSDNYLLREIKEQFRLFKGGQVALRKDENSGIAFITIDHSERKNAISGNRKIN